jgi:hypothetical protein
MYKAFIFILLILLIIFYGLRSVEAQSFESTKQDNRTAMLNFDGNGGIDPTKELS